MRATDALPGTAFARTVVVGVIAAALGWGSASGAAAAPTPTPSSSSKAEAVGERLTRRRAGRGVLQLVRGGPAAAGRVDGGGGSATDRCSRTSPAARGPTEASSAPSWASPPAPRTPRARWRPTSRTTTPTPSGWPSRRPAGCATSSSAAKKAVTYSLTSANDSPERDPKDLTLQGSADGTTWTDLDRQTGLDFADRFETKSFTVATPGVLPLLPAQRHRQPRGRHHPARRLGPQRGPGGQPAGHPPMVTDGRRRSRSGFNIKSLVGLTGCQGAALRRPAHGRRAGLREEPPLRRRHPGRAEARS